MGLLTLLINLKGKIITLNLKNENKKPQYHLKSRSFNCMNFLYLSAKTLISFDIFSDRFREIFFIKFKK